MGGEQISDPLVPHDDGQTSLTHEELKGLVPSHITLRGELNEVEQANIISAQSWAYKRNNKVLSLIQIELKELIDNTTYWIDHNTYGLDEIAASVHPSLCQRQWQAIENGRRSSTEVHGTGTLHMGQQKPD